MRFGYKQVLVAGAALVIAGCAGAAPGGTGTPADEQAIRAIGPAFAASMTPEGMKNFGNLMDSSYEEVAPDGTHSVGVKATVDKMIKDASGLPPMQMSATTTFVKFLSDRIAVTGGTYAMPAGAGMPGIHGAWLATVVKRDSTWKMVSSLGGNDDGQLMKMMAMDSMAPSKAAKKGK